MCARLHNNSVEKFLITLADFSEKYYFKHSLKHFTKSAAVSLSQVKTHRHPQMPTGTHRHLARHPQSSNAHPQTPTGACMHSQN